MTVSHATKINRLFEVMHKRGEPPVSTRAAAEAISDQSGVHIGVEDLEALRSGDKTDPTTAELSAIARFFGVSERYLLSAGPVADIEAQLGLLRGLRDAGIRAAGGGDG